MRHVSLNDYYYQRREHPRGYYHTLSISLARIGHPVSELTRLYRHSFSAWLTEQSLYTFVSLRFSSVSIPISFCRKETKRIRSNLGRDCSWMYFDNKKINLKVIFNATYRLSRDSSKVLLSYVKLRDKVFKVFLRDDKLFPFFSCNHDKASSFTRRIERASRITWKSRSWCWRR